MMLADELPYLLAAWMLLDHVANVSTVWTVTGALVYTVPSAFLPKTWERFPNESVNAK